MKIILGIVLTIAVLSTILIIRKKRNRALARIIYSQMDMHNFLKVFFREIIQVPYNKTSQSIKRKTENTIRVIAIDNKAYWVEDNTFYVGDVVEGTDNPQNGVPVDTSNMSKSEVDKMLFILDHLSKEKRSDSSGTGNE